MRGFAAGIMGCRRWLRHTAHGAPIHGLIMIGLIWAGIGIHYQGMRAGAERAAVQNSDNLARAFSVHLERSLRDIDRSLKIARSRYVLHPDKADFRKWLRESELFDAETLQISIIGADGFLELSSLAKRSAVNTDLRDREHFRVHAGTDRDDLFISTPVVGRVSGKWSIQLTRRIQNRDGSFGGVIVASLNPDYLSHVYASVNVGDNGFVDVVGTDGVIRAVGGSGARPLGRDLSKTVLFEQYPRRSAGWFYATDAGGGHLLTFRAVPDFPLVIQIGLATDEIFSAVHADRRFYDLVGAALTVPILIFIVASMNGYRLREQMSASLNLQNARLEQTRRFLDTIVEHVPVPIVVKDAATMKFILVNRAYVKFGGLPAADVIGKTVFELFAPDDAERLFKYDEEALRFRKGLVVGDFQVMTPANGLRVVNSQRLVVSDGDENPQYLIAVIDDVTDRRKAEEKIAYMAHHDPLTGLFNRQRFNECLDEGIAGVMQGGELAVLVLDLDRFKQVNDTHGHLVGDALLKIAADRMRGCTRTGDTVARLGGDEFAIIRAGIEGPDDVLRLADRIRAAVKAPYDLDAVQVVVGVSIGIARAPGDAVTAGELMRRADLALYQAKSEGRDAVRLFTPQLDARATVQRELEVDLREAIARGELELLYQPIVDIRSCAIVALQALLRWHRPGHGTMSPPAFMAATEEAGLVHPLAEWALQQACTDAANWPAPMKISVTLSPAQLERQNLTEIVTFALATSGLSPERLELEISQKALADSPHGLAVLAQLRQFGIQIVVDDFQVGSSSLDGLRRRLFDKVRIGPSLVGDLPGGNELSLALVEAVVHLAKVSGVGLRAAGVETEAQLDLVRLAGCTEYQGDLFCPPRTAADIADLLCPLARPAVAAE